MSPQQRQAILMLPIPGLVLGIFYVYFIARPLLQEIKDLEASVAKVKLSGPNPLQEAQLLAKERRLRAEIERIRKLLPSTAGTSVEADQGRAESGRRLSSILEHHRLKLLDEVTETASGALPPGLLPAASKTAAPPPPVPGGVRSLRFEGRYHQVLDALKELDGSEHHALPLRVRMARDPDRAQALLWTLVVWL